MKLVTAIVREAQLRQIHESLVEAGITRLTVGRVSGHGKRVKEEFYRGQIITPDLVPKMRLEIAVNDDFLQTTIDAIVEGAKKNNSSADGEIGDGKIFVTELQQCIRIRTGENGSKAI